MIVLILFLCIVISFIIVITLSIDKEDTTIEKTKDLTDDVSILFSDDSDDEVI